MLENIRTKKLAMLGALAVVLALGAGPVALACISPPSTPTLTTTVLYNTGSGYTNVLCTTGKGGPTCSTDQETPSSTTGVEDSAILTLNEKSFGCDEWSIFGSGFGSSYTTGWYKSGGSDNCYGNVSFYLVSLGSSSFGTCPSTTPSGATAEGTDTVTGSGTYTSNPTTSLTAGNYYYYVVYTGTGPHGTWGDFKGLAPDGGWGASPTDWGYYYPSVVGCEPFSVSIPGFPAPPISTPQFPLGIALLLALAIPGLLLIRSKYASKTSPIPVRA